MISPPQMRRFLVRPELSLEGLFRLNRETDRNVGGSIEGLEHFVAKQTPILALDAWPRGQLDAAITGMANGTGQV